MCAAYLNTVPLAPQECQGTSLCFSRCRLLPEPGGGGQRSRESQVTDFSSPVPTLSKNWVFLLEETPGRACFL